MATNLKRTDELEDEGFMRDAYKYDSDEVVPDRVDTHDGAWIKEVYQGLPAWRWWAADAE